MEFSSGNMVRLPVYFAKDNEEPITCQVSHNQVRTYQHKDVRMYVSVYYLSFCCALLAVLLYKVLDIIGFHFVV